MVLHLIVFRGKGNLASVRVHPFWS